MKNYREKTLQYYSMWLGETDMLTSKFDDINVIYSEERNHPQKGYDSVFDLYLFFCYGKWFISYGEKCLGQIMDLVNNITKDMTVNDVKALVRALYKRDIDHNIKYVFKEYAPRENNANVLERSDFEYYEAFFKKCNPNCLNVDWLKEYFEEMIREHLCVGVFEQNVLVCCTDAPSMPYMESQVQEIGINTLPNYRGNGYATNAALRCIEEILRKGKVPLWSTSIDNIASQKLAEKVGFEKFAEVLMVTL